MPEFKYIAQNSAAATVQGSVEATDRNGAIQAVRQQGLRLISLSEAKKKASMSFSIGQKHVSKKDLVMFTRQFSTMISAGVPIVRALNTLALQSENPGFKTVLEVVIKDVESGMELGDALAKHPQVFNDIYVNMVRAGEAAGILDDILKRLALQQEKSESIRKKVKSASTYPMILIVITVIAFFGLMFFVIPKIGNILHDLGGPDAKLPVITTAMLAISSFMKTYWYIVIGGLAAIVFGVRYFLKTPFGKSFFDHNVIKMPVFGQVVRKLAVARFARTYASLLGAGVSVLEALHITGEAIGNTAYAEQLDQAGQQIKAGQSLSAVLAKSDLFPTIIPQMLAVGEETGRTDQVLVKVADFYEEEVDALIEGLSSIIEPIMIVVMGGMVGLVAVSVMGPIASLSQNIKG